jgi:Tol biopolymer transport system component
VLWYDDTTLLAGNRHPGLFDLNGKLIKRLANQGNHPSLSPDRKWWVAEIGKSREIRLHRTGSPEYTVISGDVKEFAGGHVSFSRDGKYVFFTGKSPSDRHPAVYRVDVSSITKAE